METKHVEMSTPVDGKEDHLALADFEGDIPQSVLDNIAENKRFIWWSLVFLNGSVLWAYYSCLSAQSYYEAKFSAANFNFYFLTTPASTWPMFVGHTIQLVFGLDKKLSMWYRVMIGYVLFIVCALIILAQQAFNTTPDTGATLVLISFGLVGATNTLTEAAFYALSSLFPDSAFTDAVQVGNGLSGVLNITLNTVIRLIVGGIHPAGKDAERIQSVSFYIFFSALILVCLIAMYLFTRLIKVKGIQYLIARNNAETARRAANREPLTVHWARLLRITGVIIVPFISQFIIFVLSLTVYPGIGCSSGFQLAPAGGASWTSWYCSPGVIGTYNYGDFAGRIVAPLLVSRINLKWCFGLTWLRWAFFFFLLMGLPGVNNLTKESPSNPLFAFDNARQFAQFWQLFMYVLVGFTNGLLSTITFALGPRLVPQEDRESAGALMVLALFGGICSGATIGLQFDDQHWLGA
ncbi:hypothetical protein LEN26_005377 [Aphanomyces euteiches]|nr:hypothetical protein AeMF1_009064 [Aphanomyces euteiches]KAH9138248.1 hypothetical protein LEN26_005377 [Aphanomyces euteiches]KAH9167264.1 hypothetical protein AeNC1_018181 [Aphanomyces euteiches]